MKRIISLFICIVVIFCAFLFTVEANETDNCYRYYYEQLTDAQKYYYDIIKDLTPASGKTEFAAYESYPTTLVNDEDFSQEFLDYPANVVFPDVFVAVDALLKDDVYAFWLGFGPGLTTYGYRTEVTGNDFDYETMNAYTTYEYTFNINPVPATQYSENTQSYINAVKTVIDEFETDSVKRSGILRDIVDYLANNIEYVINGAYAHEIYGALVAHESVCEGYAKSFKAICDKYEIPCVMVVGDGTSSGSSEAHMWNSVQMEDGKWYGIDATWGDQAERGIFYDFFLVGSETEAEHFDCDIYKISHAEDGDFSGVGRKVFTYPELSTTAFDLASEALFDGVELYKIDLIEGVDGIVRGLKDGITAEKLAAAFDVTVKNSSGAVISGDTLVGTGCSVVNGDSEVYIVVIPGDVNGDGEIKVTDYLLIKRCFLGLNTIEGLQFAAADIDGDKRISCIDYLCVKRYLFGTYDIFNAFYAG